MKFNLKTPVLDFRHEPLKQPAQRKPTDPAPKPGDPPAEEIVTFRKLIDVVLTNEAASSGPIGAEQAAQMYQIANKIWRSWKVDLTDRDTVLIKERAAIVFPNNVLFRGRLEDFLDHRDLEAPLSEEEQDKELEEDDKPLAPAGNPKETTPKK